MINKSHPNQGCKFLECFSCFYLSPNCREKHQLHKLNWLQSVTVFIPQSNQNLRIISAVSFYCLQWYSGGGGGWESPVLPSFLGWNATADCRGPPACCCCCCSTLSPPSSTLPVKMRQREISVHATQTHIRRDNFHNLCPPPPPQPPRSKQQMWACFTTIYSTSQSLIAHNWIPCRENRGTRLLIVVQN